MKTFVWLISLLTCTVCATQAKTKTVERPAFTAWSSTSIEIDRIVREDTATTMYVKAYYRPHFWIKIAKGSFLRDEDGQLYPIRRGVGITLDKEFWMPESGEAEFQLIFPPLPRTVSTVDFSEGDFEGAYNIWGIQLDGRKLDKSKLPQKPSYPDRRDTLPQPELAYGKAVLTGRILDYRKEMNLRVRAYTHGLSLTEQGEESSLPVNDDGTFRIEIEAPCVASVRLAFPFGFVTCLVAPGEETDVTVNPREMCRRQSRLQPKNKSYGEAVYYKGYLAGLQQERESYRGDLSLGTDDYSQFSKDIAGKTPAEFKSYLLTKLADSRKDIERAKLSGACEELLNITLDINAALSLFDTEMYLKDAYVIAHKLSEDEAMTYYRDTRIDIPEDYYDTLKELASINTFKAIYAENYINLIYSDEIKQKLTEMTGSREGPLFDNSEAIWIYQSVKEFNPLTAEQEARLRSLSSPAYLDLLAEANRRLLRVIEENKRKEGFTVNEVGDVTNERLFPSILSKFSGHTLLVDFWATWCGPCRTAHKLMRPLKEELKKEDIVYVYVTGESSPQSTWENMITDIPGEHFRLTEAQWRYLSESLKLRGVPTYFVVDRKGNVTYRSVGFPGTGTLKEQLLKAIK